MKYLLAGDHRQLTWHEKIFVDIQFICKVRQIHLSWVEETLSHVRDVEAGGDDDEGEPGHVHLVQAEAQLCTGVVTGGGRARLRRDLER